MPREALLARVLKCPVTRIIVAASREYKSLRLSSNVGAHAGPHPVDSLRGDGVRAHAQLQHMSALAFSMPPHSGADQKRARVRLHSRSELALDALLVSPYLRAEGGVLKASVRIPSEADRARRQMVCRYFSILRRTVDRPGSMLAECPTEGGDDQPDASASQYRRQTP